MRKIYFPVSNFYGIPTVEYNKDEEKFYLSIGDHDGENSVEVSEEFFDCCVKEFKNKDINIENCNFYESDVE